MSTHYDTLRVEPCASDAQIRDAYRRLAREHHPDRQASAGSAAGSVSMPSINEAYRVLGDPARRAVYDASLRRSTSGSASGSASTSTPQPAEPASAYTAPMHPSHLGPARIPWRSLLVVGIIGVIGVVVLAQFTEPGEPAGPDGILGVGSCVAIDSSGFASEVLCTGDAAADLVVDALIPFDATCPGRTEPHQDRQGMGIACIAAP